MATLLRHGARKPLATRGPNFGYGMRHEIHNGEYGATITVHDGEEGPTYTLHLTNDEIDRLVAQRNRGRDVVAGYQ